MRPAASGLPAPIDVRVGGLLLANMLLAWLDDDPEVLSTREASHESQDRRTSPEPTSLRVFTPVDTEPSPPPSGEHGASVCTAPEGAGTGLERIPDSHAGSGSGQVGHRNGSTGGLLQVVVMSRTIDPRLGEITYKLTEVQRGEPAHSLFE